MDITKPDADPGQILLVNKPYRWTSFDVVKKVRNVLAKADPENPGKKKRLKIGHAGTLDPLATGLLILCTGAMTKRIQEIQDAEKEYTGTITLGATRPSYDMETEVDQTFPTDHINEDMILKAALQFTGEIQQVPPIHSAIMVDGVRAYKKARRGQDIELKPREIAIRTFEIVEISMPVVRFRVVCSKGTYIRSLAFDFGRFLDSGAFLSELCRTRIGEHRLTEAHDMDYFIQMS